MSRSAVIFDLDGVLIDSWQIAQRALALALSDVGYPGEVSLEHFRALLGKPLPVILRDLELPSAAEAAFNAHAMSLVAEVRPFPQVGNMLARLQAASIAIGIVTGKARQRTVAILDRTGLAPFVDALITPDDAPGKPDPRALWQCLAALRTDDALCFVGDTMIDNQVARAAAIPAALATWGGGGPFKTNAWDFLFEEPDDVVHLVLGK